MWFLVWARQKCLAFARIRLIVATGHLEGSTYGALQQTLHKLERILAALFLDARQEALLELVQIASVSNVLVELS